MPPSKVKIERISGDRTRQNTFHKRKLGLLKKAIELTVLCDCDCAIILRSGPTVMCPDGKLSAYCSKDLQEMLSDFMCEMPMKYYTNAEYSRFSKDDKEDCSGHDHDIISADGEEDSLNAKGDQAASKGPAKIRDQSAALKQQLEDIQNELANYAAPSSQIGTQMSAMSTNITFPILVSESVSRKRDASAITKEDDASKRQCTEADVQQIAYSAEASDEPNLSTLIEDMERSQMPPEGLMLKRETSSSLAPGAFKIQRETSWDLSTLFSSTPTSGPGNFFSPCNRMVAPGVLVPQTSVAGCQLLPTLLNGQTLRT